LLLVGPFAQAQTIADYSRAQRALLESTMSQAAARSIGFAASAPNVAVPASTPAPAASPQRSTPPSLPAPGPGVQVSGVFASSAVSVAEVVVDATAYLLQAGQGVPGTPWRVEAVAVDRVVLSRRGAASFADGDGAVKVFALPALR
jgi:type II secretory pathway component PulC